MVDTLFFVHADGHELEELAQAYRLHGWDVVDSAPLALDALDRMAASHPVAAVFYLDGDCSGDVRAFAEAALADDRTKNPLMVFIGGAAEDIADARATAPRGIFVRPDELAWVLKRLIIKM